MKGQRLRLLPEPLARCEKALIWSWDQSVVGGLGGKFEGNLVKGNLLLHYLNSMTKYSAVIVQPLSLDDLDETGNIITMDIPLPLKNADGSISSTIVGDGLPKKQVSNLILLLDDLSNKIDLSIVGYLHLVRLHRDNESSETPENESYEWIPLSIEFGIPLFNPKLCEKICERVVESKMLQKEDITEYYEIMQNVRKTLRELCTEYQATGPTARLFNQRGGSKNNSPRKLVKIVSSKWSPFHDPPSPTHPGSPSKQDIAKPTKRQKCFTEVLSFDGSILRYHLMGLKNIRKLCSIIFTKIHAILFFIDMLSSIQILIGHTHSLPYMRLQQDPSLKNNHPHLLQNQIMMMQTPRMWPYQELI